MLELKQLVQEVILSFCSFKQHTHCEVIKVAILYPHTFGGYTRLFVDQYVCGNNIML